MHTVELHIRVAMEQILGTKTWFWGYGEHGVMGVWGLFPNYWGPWPLAPPYRAPTELQTNKTVCSARHNKHTRPGM